MHLTKAWAKKAWANFKLRNNFNEEAYKLSERQKVEEWMKSLPFYQETVEACLKFRHNRFRTLKDQMTPLERLQDHYFRIQVNPLYQLLKKLGLIP